MRLQQINEVFDKPNLDGVNVSGDSYVTEYTFLDPNSTERIIYKVRIRNNSGYAFKEFMENQFDEMEPDDVVDIKHKLKRFGSGVLIEFTAGTEYSKTGLNNEFFVYGKLIACVYDYVKKNKPIFLKFSGATDDMDLVYNRFLKLGNRANPADVYVPFNDEMHVRKDFTDLFDNYESDVYSGVANYNHVLKSARSRKNKQRNSSFR